jgi:hypothetical protein
VSCRKDVAHHADLVAAFEEVLLIDADSIDPKICGLEHAVPRSVSVQTRKSISRTRYWSLVQSHFECLKAIGAEVEVSLIDIDPLPLAFGITPCVRKAV